MMHIKFFFLRQIAMPDSSIYFNILQHEHFHYEYIMIQDCAWRISSALQYNNDGI